MFVKSNIIAQFVYGTPEGMFQLKRIKIGSTQQLEALFSQRQDSGARDKYPA